MSEHKMFLFYTLWLSDILGNTNVEEKDTPKITFFKSGTDSYEIHFHTLFCLQFKGLRNIYERYKDNYDQNGCKAN